MAYIATHLGEFEVNPFVHNDEEYGKFLVTESGLFDVDELLLVYDTLNLPKKSVRIP